MGGFKQMKTATLGIVVQVTEIASDAKDRRRWEVHDVERNRGFRVTLSDRQLVGRPQPEIDGAIGLAIERFLKASPDLLAGPLYEVEVTGRDFSDFTSLG